MFTLKETFFGFYFMLFEREGLQWETGWTVNASISCSIHSISNEWSLEQVTWSKNVSCLSAACAYEGFMAGLNVCIHCFFAVSGKTITYGTLMCIIPIAQVGRSVERSIFAHWKLNISWTPLIEWWRMGENRQWNVLINWMGT